MPHKNELTLAYGLSSMLAVLLVSSVFGLLYGGEGFYGSYPASLAGLVGQEAVTVVLSIPLLLSSMRLTRRGSTGTLLVWAEALFYFTYSYYFYVIEASTPSSWSEVSWGCQKLLLGNGFIASMTKIVRLGDARSLLGGHHDRCGKGNLVAR